MEALNYVIPPDIPAGMTIAEYVQCDDPRRETAHGITAEKGASTRTTEAGATGTRREQ